MWCQMSNHWIEKVLTGSKIMPTDDIFDSLVWFGNHCRLFNAKSGLFIYVRYIWFVNKVK